MVKSTVKARQATKAKRSESESKTFMLFGSDELARPRAARYTGTDQAALEKAANRHRLRLVLVVGPALQQIAKRLPAGGVNDAGHPAPLPFVPEGLYADLVGLTAGKHKQPPETKPPKGLPTNRADIGVGHLVIAHESLECGWREAIVVERAEDLFTLQYRDFPTVPPIVRHLSAVALMWSKARTGVT
jgi:hypothetical protein